MFTVTLTPGSLTPAVECSERKGSSIIVLLVKSLLLFLRTVVEILKTGSLTRSSVECKNSVKNIALQVS